MEGKHRVVLDIGERGSETHKYDTVVLHNNGWVECAHDHRDETYFYPPQQVYEVVKRDRQ